MEKRVYVYIFILVIAIFVVIYFILGSKGIGPTGKATTDSQTGNLTVGILTYMACTWSDVALNVSFGSSLNPDSADINASENYNCPTDGSCYNITVDILSTANADITISGEDLRSSGNILEIGNASYQVNTTDLDGINLVPAGSTLITGSPVDMITDEPVDSTVWYRLWLDIPAEIVAGSYVGNYTLICEEES